MRALGIGLALVMVFLLTPSVYAFDLRSDRAIVLAGMNAARVKAGLVPLIESASLDATAQWRSEDMLTDNCFSHIVCDTDDYVWPYIKIPFSYGGENITWNSYPDALSALAAVQGWLSSPGHRANILGRYTLVGIGVAYRAPKRMFTTIFILPKGASQSAPKPKPASRPVVPVPIVLPATDTSG